MPAVPAATLSGKVLKRASYIEKREDRFKLTTAVSAGFTKNAAVEPVWMTESFASSDLAVKVQLRYGFNVYVRVTVTCALPETELVSRTVSGGVVLEMAVTINLDKLIAALFSKAPTLAKTKVETNVPFATGMALSAVLLIAKFDPQLIRIAA